MLNQQKLNKSIWILLALSSFGLSTSALAAPQSRILLLEVKGTVEKSQSKAKKPQRVFEGYVLDVLDWLNPIKGASAKIYCSNGSTHKIRSGQKINVGKVCGILIRPDDNAAPPRGSDDLSDAEKKELQEELKILSEQPLNNEAKSIGKAHLYLSKGLSKEAIDELKKLVDAGSKTTAVYQLLGDIYRSRGLYKEAKTTYETGLKLAQKEGNDAAVEMIQSALSIVNN
jgi:tetratricopeptide (TPR) repeat protein